ncbi:MAG: phosphoribosylanthranilate isomerase [Candidatus Helarchaeota archaeon]
MEFIKICGLKELEHVEICKKGGADAVGFIYKVNESPRNIDEQKLRSILKEVSDSIKTVLVIRPGNVKEVEDMMTEINASLYQVHMGRGIIDINKNISELKNLPIEYRKRIILALRINKENFNKIKKILVNNKDEFYAFLIDNSEGSGKFMNYELISSLIQYLRNVRIILAGGISINNVENIIRNIRPYGIDVSSSLELERGIKDPVKIINFLKKVHEIKKELKG